jgi:hypothetical protein
MKGINMILVYRNLIARSSEVLLFCLFISIMGCSNLSDTSMKNENVIVKTASLKTGYIDEQTSQLLKTANEIEHTFSNGTIVSLINVGDYTFLNGGDVSVSRRDLLPQWIEKIEKSQIETKISTRGVGISPTALDSNQASALWPSAKDLGVIYYEIGSFPLNIRTVIDQAIASWNATSVGIKWQPRIIGSTYRYVTIVSSTTITIPSLFVNGSPCSVVAGFSGGGIGYTSGAFPVGSTIYLNSNCFVYYPNDPAGYSGVVQHEMGHVVGLWHEQQYCGRDKYITIAAPLPGTFDIVGGVIYSFNFTEKCDLNAKNYNSFNYSSIMHYRYGPGVISQRASGPADLSYCGNIGDPYYNRIGLSSGDIAAINELYNRSANTPSSICSVNIFYEPYGFIQDNSVRLLGSGSQIKLRVRVNGYKLNNSNVIWTVTPNIGSYFVSAIPNSTDVNFNYTAPSVSSPSQIIIKATSVQDTSKYATATLNVKLISDYKELKRFYNPAPLNPYNTGDHWVTTGVANSGYNRELFNGTLSSDPTTIYLRNTGITPLYSCTIGNDHFISLQSNCEGQVGLGILGYIDATNSGPQSHVPIYRCYTGTDHFVSTDSQCEKSIAGNQTRINEGLLGYGITNP